MSGNSCDEGRDVINLDQDMPFAHHARHTFVPDLASPAWALDFTHEEDIPFHDHIFYELVYIRDGRAIHETLNRSREVKSGELILVRPGIWHRYVLTRCDHLSLTNILIARDVFADKLSWLFDEPFFSPFLLADPRYIEGEGILCAQLNAHESRRVESAIESIREMQVHKENPMRMTYVLADVLHCFGVLGEALFRMHKDPVLIETPLHGAVQTALQLMSERLNESWSVARLASESLNVSASYLLGLFRTQLGVSPMTVLFRYRMDRAAGLLMSTTLAVSEIGSEVGIPDPNYFTRCFREHFKATPSEVRKRGSLNN